mgnify:FL=1
MSDYAIDPFFGKIFIGEDNNYASCGFSELTNILYEKVSSKTFTSHLRRISKEYDEFTLRESYSNSSIEKLLNMLDPSQVDLVKIYSWTRSYRFFGMELVFIDCSSKVESCWTFDGSHEGELIDTFLSPIKKSSLAEKTIVQSWNGEPTFSNLTENNLRQSLPTFTK